MLGFAPVLASALLGVSALLAPLAASAQEPTLDDAIQLLEEDKIPEAISLLEGLRAAGNDDFRVQATLGALYVETQNLDGAWELLSPLADSSNDPGLLYNAGRAAIGINNMEAALEYLNRSAQLAPNSPARRALGLLMAPVGQTAEAYTHLRAWLRSNPDDQQARLIAALSAVQLERIPEAEDLLAGLDQEEPRVRLLWAQVLQSKGDPYGALGYLRELKENAPESMQRDIVRGLARAYTTIGESASAIELLEGQTDMDPELSLQLADAYYQSGRVDDGLALLKPFAQRIRAAQDRSAAGDLGARIVLTFGRQLLTSGQSEAAIKYLELATQMDPNQKLGWQNLGQALAAQGRAEEARAAIDRFQTLLNQEGPEIINEEEKNVADPTGREVRLAMEKFQSGDSEGALNILLRESELNPNDPRPPLLASRFLLLLQRPQEALPAVEQALALGPQNPDSHYQKGAVLMALEQFSDAEQNYRQALEFNPNHTGAMNDLAVLLLQNGDRQEAESLLERALSLRPDDPVAQDNLRRLRDGGSTPPGSR